MSLYIAVPAYRGIVCPSFIDSLEATGVLLTEMGIPYKVEILSGCCYIQMARNYLVDKFLDTDYQKILFLDDDISWDPKDVLRLMNSSHKVVAGVYRTKSYEEDYPVVLRCNENNIPLCNSEGELDAPCVPAGFLCIDRSVFIDIEVSYPHLAFKDIKRGTEEWEDFFDFFPQGVSGGRWVGEDYAFCNLWTGLGNHIVVIPDMTLSHHSNTETYTGNLKEWLLKLPGGINHAQENVRE